MKMIVGLGNPGLEFQYTRHNIGFMVVDNYLNKRNIKMQEKFNGLYAKVFLNNESFLIVKPLSYMNLSGQVVKKYADYFKINPKDILIIQDDLDMPIGKIKLKYKGSSGGHNGIKNIISELNTEYFPRFKVGISKSDKISIRDYVISKFSKQDEEIIGKILDFSDNIIEDFITVDFEKMMSKYNGADYEIK